MLETSAPESLYGSQFTLSTQLIIANYLHQINFGLIIITLASKHFQADFTRTTTL